jgi:lipopolysaccharide/colanic/teichoic acid biosynthesis glycosyltransferase
MLRKYIFGFLLNSVILVFSFFFLSWLKLHMVIPPAKIKITFLFFFGTYTMVSLITKKYRIVDQKHQKDILSTIAISNMVGLIVFGILIRYLTHFIEFRFVIIYSVLLSAVLEFVAAYFLVQFNRSINRSFYQEQEDGTPGFYRPAPAKVMEKYVPVTREPGVKPVEIDLHSIIIEETNEKTYEFISKYFASASDTLIVSTSTRFNVANQPKEKYRVIINLTRINDFQYINKFFELVNKKLDPGGIFIDWVETYSMKKKKILSKYMKGVNYLVYYFDFLFHRVFPKLPVTKKIYFFITKGRNRVLSMAESFGRLYSCGFEIVEEQFIDDRLFFVVRKVKEPAFDYHPTYGPIIRLKRIGKNGKIIGVYKLRTMHAYSEYLQGYIHELHSLQEGGKFRNDFRITTLGRIFRKLWIDELPMLINLVKGELKIVGVRPLSQHYFNLYSEELQQKRLKYKPGLIPPFYADLPKTLAEIMESESRYLEAYDKSPVLTDVRYFFKAFYNIIFRHARSN